MAAIAAPADEPETVIGGSRWIVPPPTRHSTTRVSDDGCVSHATA
jgi:hypothetical protein